MLRDIRIGMSPDLVDSASFHLTWHGLFALIGVAVAVFVIARVAMRSKDLQQEARQRKMRPDDMVYNIALWAIIGGIIGARFVHVVDQWGFYSNNPGEIIKVWEGGIALWGGLLGGLFAGLAAGYLQLYPLAKLMDIAPVGLLAGQGIGRIGDIINGEHYSKLTSLPWGVWYSHPDNPSVQRAPSLGLTPESYVQHPVVAYELFFDLFLAWVFFKLLGRLKPDGMVYVAYLATYGLWRFFIQFYRDDDVKFAGLQEAHVIALLVVVIAVPILVYKARWVKAAPVPKLQAKKAR